MLISEDPCEPLNVAEHESVRLSIRLLLQPCASGAEGKPRPVEKLAGKIRRAAKMHRRKYLMQTSGQIIVRLYNLSSG
jgi:hypothetical protein